MLRCKIDLKRDGFISGSQLEQILSEVAEVIADRFNSADAEIEKLRGEVKALRGELETERRLRLSMPGRGRK